MTGRFPFGRSGPQTGSVARPRPPRTPSPDPTDDAATACPAPAAGPDGPFRVAIRVKPRARRDHVGGTRGGGELVVEVQAPAVDGRANAAVEAVMADAFGLSRRQVHLVAGERSRTKLVDLDGPSDLLAARLAELLG